MDSLLSYIGLIGFGDGGWGVPLLRGLAMTITVSICGFLIGSSIGIVLTAMRVSEYRFLQKISLYYTTIIRGVPDILVMYIFYFGGISLVTTIANQLGHKGFIDLPGFLVGCITIGIISAAYQSEVFRGGYRAVDKGMVEAGKAVGMSNYQLLTRILAPQVLIKCLPHLGNIWQLAIKESALISLVGLTELMRVAALGVAATKLSFQFYTIAAILFIVISSASMFVFNRLENRFRKMEKGL